MLNDPKFAVAQGCFEAACEMSRWHSEVLRDALNRYGDHGPAVSGAGRDHFPMEVKNVLRRAARLVATCSDAGYAARPPRVRMSTMRKLAAAVAKRDGSGFYGPQA